MPRNQLAEALDAIVRRINNLEQQVSNPKVVGLYPTSGMMVDDITVDGQLFGLGSHPSIVQDVTIDNFFNNGLPYVIVSWTPPDTGVVQYYVVQLAHKLDSTTYDVPVLYNSNDTSWKFTDLTSGETYGLKIGSYSQGGFQGAQFPDESNWYDFTVPPDTDAPSVITGLAVSATEAAIIATWAESIDPDVLAYGHYRVQLSDDNFTTILTARHCVENVTVFGGLTGGVLYYVRAFAVDRSNNVSPPSLTVTATPPSAYLIRRTAGTTYSVDPSVRFVEVTVTPFTVNLAAVGIDNDGQEIYVINASSGNITVQAAGSDTIGNDASPPGSVTLASGGFIHLISSDASGGYRQI
jgi:hypothetical protein